MTMNIKKTSIPQSSLANKYLPAYYSDSFECSANFSEEILSEDFLIAFWTIRPGWINSLFKLRNALVKPLGLGSSDNDFDNDFKACIKSDAIVKDVTLLAKTPSETIITLNDKQLHAYISVYVEDQGYHIKKVNVSTIVKFHYWLGNVYFFFIRPFHYLICKAGLKYALNKILSSGLKSY